MAGIYIHIPFCKQACNYCNFHFSTSTQKKDDFLNALRTEIKLMPDVWKNQSIETVYFGGGTPSLLSVDELQTIFSALHKKFDVANAKEFTLECNPDDLSQSYFQKLKSTPVNRLSIGVQSFHENDLRFMNRAHVASQSIAAIKTAQDAGFNNLTVDLIYGTPGLTDALWAENLEQIARLQIPHFSAYALTVENGTALDLAIKRKKQTTPEEAAAAKHFEMLSGFALQNGYRHYEISNLCLPGFEALHNSNYWKNLPYLGLGPSAHSFDGEKRWWNMANNSLYIDQLSKNILPIKEVEILTKSQRYNEYLMTSLRTIWGCDLGKIKTDFGEDYSEDLMTNAKVYLENGQLRLENNHLKFSLSGQLLGDAITAALFQTHL